MGTVSKNVKDITSTQEEQHIAWHTDLDYFWSYWSGVEGETIWLRHNIRMNDIWTIGV